MASKKKQSIDKVAAKSVNDMSKGISELGQKAREALSSLEGAFFEKSQELEGVMEAIQAKQEELEELHGKEKVLQDIDTLKEELEDKQNENERSMKRLSQSMEDKQLELVRKHRMIDTEFKQKMEDEVRARRIAREDEDRAREIDFQKRTSELDDQAKLLAAKEVELGSFDEAVKKKSDKAIAAASREMKFKEEKREAEHKAVQDIMEAKIQTLTQENIQLKERIDTLEDETKTAQDRAQAIAVASLDKEAGKAALEHVQGLASKMAESPRR